jgi:hypothetical protein
MVVPLAEVLLYVSCPPNVGGVVSNDIDFTPDPDSGDFLGDVTLDPKDPECPALFPALLGIVASRHVRFRPVESPPQGMTT